MIIHALLNTARPTRAISITGHAAALKGKSTKRGNRKGPASVWMAVFLFCLLTLVNCSSGKQKSDVAAEKNTSQKEAQPVYHIRAVVIDAQGTPVEEATVRASLGSESKKVSGAWQIDVPSASLPLNGTVTVYATAENPSRKGESDIQLSADHNPSVTVRLAPTRK